MGMALTSCTVPHVGKPTFDLPEDEMEIGVGIHGEPGRTRMKVKSADEIVEMLMEPIISDIPYKAGDEVSDVCQRHGWDTSGGALYCLSQSPRDCHQERPEGCSQPDRPIHHQPGDGRLFHHDAEDG